MGGTVGNLFYRSGVVSVVRDWNKTEDQEIPFCFIITSKSARALHREKQIIKPSRKPSMLTLLFVKTVVMFSPIHKKHNLYLFYIYLTRKRGLFILVRPKITSEVGENNTHHATG